MLFSRSSIQDQPQPEEASDNKAGNQILSPYDDYAECNSTARPLRDQAASLSNDFSLMICLIWSRLKDPSVILYLIQKHNIDSFDSHKQYYESVFESLSDTQSSRLLEIWVHALSDGADFPYNPFWWPSSFEFNKSQEQKSEGMLR